MTEVGMQTTFFLFMKGAGETWINHPNIQHNIFVFLNYSIPLSTEILGFIVTCSLAYWPYMGS